MALAPCLIGYGAIAKRLYSEKSTVRHGNLYWKWVENYVADDYTEAVRLGSGMSSLVVDIFLSDQLDRTAGETRKGGIT